RLRDHGVRPARFISRYVGRGGAPCARVPYSSSMEEPFVPWGTAIGRDTANASPGKSAQDGPHPSPPVDAAQRKTWAGAEGSALQSYSSTAPIRAPIPTATGSHARAIGPGRAPHAGPVR